MRSWRLRRIRDSGTSRIHPVQEPAWLRQIVGRVAIKPGAEEPEAQAGLVLDAEIIARRTTRFAPPGAFDALGAFDGYYLVQSAAPAEAQRRSVGHDGEDVHDRLGLGEQAQRPRAAGGLGAEMTERLPAGLCSRQGLRRHGAGGELGDMAVVGDEPRYSPPSEPRAQAIDQAVERGLVLVGAEADLLVRAGLGDDDGKPRQVEAEAGIDLVAQRRQPLDEERADRLRITNRPRGAGGDALDRTVGAEERELEAPRAVAVRRHR